MEYQQLRSRRQINPKESKPPVDGKVKGSFFTYQRLCENSLATWWRNVFLMSNVALNIEKLDTEPELVPIIFLASNIVLIWATYSYYINLNDIIESANERGVTLSYNWSWIAFGIIFVILHGYFTVKLFISI